MLINPAITAFPTFGSILQLCQSLVEETPGTAHATASAEWHPWIMTAADDVAKMSDCHWATDILDLVADQTDYCPPRVYRIKAIRALDSGGAWHPVELLTRGRAPAYLGANYPHTSTASYPTYAVVGAAADDGGTFRLIPAVTTSRTGGVEVEGFAALGRVWEYDSNGVAVAMSASTPSPLPEWATMAIVSRACWYRCLQKMTHEAYAARLGPMDALFNQQMVDVRMKAADWYRETMAKRRIGL